MKLYDDGIFHIYNQGNNKRPIFLTEANYELFIWKMKAFILPFGDIIAYCLMPNHFHWLIKVNTIAIKKCDFRIHYDQIEMERRVAMYGKNAIEIKRPLEYYDDKGKWCDINSAIGTLCGSYARAFNNRYALSGSLFRSKCKAKDGIIRTFVSNPNLNFGNGNDYISKCFYYIHYNPVQAGMAKYPHDYDWSSAGDYQHLRSSSICNLELGKSLVPDTFNLDELEDKLRKGLE